MGMNLQISRKGLYNKTPWELLDIIIEVLDDFEAALILLERLHKQSGGTDLACEAFLAKHREGK
jgi:hypothetical protein